MSTNRNLRGYSEFQILKNVSNPVMFMGLPMNLALIFIGVILTACFTAMFMRSFDVPFMFTIGIPVAIAFFGITGVRYFFKRYGMKGFSMSRRNSTQPDQLTADKTVQLILRKK